MVDFVIHNGDSICSDFENTTRVFWAGWKVTVTSVLFVFLFFPYLLSDSSWRKVQSSKFQLVRMMKSMKHRTTDGPIVPC